MKFLTPLILMITLFVSGCASVPTRSQEANAAFNATKVIQVLDLLRDVAILDNSQPNPVLRTSVVKGIVRFHKTALTVIHAVPSGWKSAVTQGLNVVMLDLTPAEKHHLDPYLTVIQSVLETL